MDLEIHEILFLKLEKCEWKVYSYAKLINDIKKLNKTMR